jgi:hypothetical protein
MHLIEGYRQIENKKKPAQTPPLSWVGFPGAAQLRPALSPSPFFSSWAGQASAAQPPFFPRDMLLPPTPSPSRLGPEPRWPNSAWPSRQRMGATRSPGRCGRRFGSRRRCMWGPPVSPGVAPCSSPSPPRCFFLLSPSLSSPRTVAAASVRSTPVPR